MGSLSAIYERKSHSLFFISVYIDALAIFVCKTILIVGSSAFNPIAHFLHCKAVLVYNMTKQRKQSVT